MSTYGVSYSCIYQVSQLLSAHYFSISYLEEASLLLILVTVLPLSLRFQLSLAIGVFLQYLDARSCRSRLLTLAWGSSSEATALLFVDFGGCGGFGNCSGGVLAASRLDKRGLALLEPALMTHGAWQVTAAWVFLKLAYAWLLIEILRFHSEVPEGLILLLSFVQG